MIRLSISNIAWSSENDETIYSFMKELGFTGLEIAPTRIFPETPYDRCPEARDFMLDMRNRYGFAIPSMQSIWYGRTEKIFGSESERRELTSYTEKAIRFAKSIGCGNLVFGCPKNRIMPEGADKAVAVEFYRHLGEFAKDNGTVIAMEPNPGIYGTNYINTTKDALDLISEVDSEGFKLNLDMGTVIENGEDLTALYEKPEIINHVHISEPYLEPVVKRKIHEDLRDLLLKVNYGGFVSIEMKKQDDTGKIKEIMEYVSDLFGESCKDVI